MAAPTFALLNGTVTATETIRSSGTVVYRLTGRVTGTIAFLPDVRDDQPIPDRLIIRMGDGDHLLATALHDLPQMSGVALVGGGDGIDLDQPGWFRQLRFRPYAQATPANRTVTANQYAVVVCQALAARYRQLDREPLIHAAARRTANRRLATTFHAQIRPTHRMVTEQRAALTAMWAVADGLQQLTPLPLLPTAAARRGCQKAAAVDPDVYVTSDDDGDWLTCPCCDRPTVMITSGATLGGLLARHATHVCPPTAAPSGAAI